MNPHNLVCVKSEVRFVNFYIKKRTISFLNSHNLVRVKREVRFVNFYI